MMFRVSLRVRTLRPLLAGFTPSTWAWDLLLLANLGRPERFFVRRHARPFSVMPLKVPSDL